MEEVVLRLGMINDRILMEQYGIANQEKEFFVKELRFIKSYRRKLYDSLNLLYEVVDDYDIEKNQKLMGLIGDLTKSITHFMFEANGYNLSRKILFSKNIDMELKEIVADMRSKNGDGYAFREFLNNVDVLSLYFQYVASETLMRDYRYVEIEEEQTQIVSDKLVQRIKKNFLDYIKENDLTKTDVLFLIGYIAQKRDETTDAIMKTPEHCEGCTRDDCMLPSVCKYNSEKVYVPSTKSKYDGIVQSLKSFLKGMPLTELDKTHILSSITDPRAREIAKRVISKEPVGKGKFEPSLDESAWAMVHEMNVKNALRHRLKNQERLNIESVDENIIGLIINNMDFSKATAEQNSRDFLKNYFFVVDSMTKLTNENGEKSVTLNKLLQTYEEALKEIKIEKGEE